MDQIELVTERIHPSVACLSVAGAVVSFEGRVRFENEGRRVRRLCYEAYRPLALKELQAVVQETRQKFSVLDIHIRHRLGEVLPGELAVWVGVWAIHRQDAFAACAEVMNQVKTRVPIWKSEQYDDGECSWVSEGGAYGSG